MKRARRSARGGTLLIAGMSGGGKSTVATGLLERFLDGGFQFCVIDPEGDYAELENTVSLGDAKHEPRLEEAVELLRHVKENLVINLLGGHCRGAKSTFRPEASESPTMPAARSN